MGLPIDNYKTSTTTIIIILIIQSYLFAARQRWAAMNEINANIKSLFFDRRPCTPTRRAYLACNGKCGMSERICEVTTFSALKWNVALNVAFKFKPDLDHYFTNSANLMHSLGITRSLNGIVALPSDHHADITITTLKCMIKTC